MRYSTVLPSGSAVPEPALKPDVAGGGVVAAVPAAGVVAGAVGAEAAGGVAADALAGAGGAAAAGGVAAAGGGTAAASLGPGWVVAALIAVVGAAAPATLSMLGSALLGATGAASE
jgi:type IV secretion system protein TrbL